MSEQTIAPGKGNVINQDDLGMPALVVSLPAAAILPAVVNPVRGGSTR